MVKGAALSLLFSLLAACATGMHPQLRALAALKAERVALDSAASAWFVERSRAAIATSKDLGEYMILMDPVHRVQERGVILARAIDQAAHAAALRIAQGAEDDQLADVRRLVCELGMLVRGAGVPVFSPGGWTMRCAP